MMTTSEDASTSSWCVMTPSLWPAAQHSVMSYQRNQSRASDVIGDVIQLSSKSADICEKLSATTCTSNASCNDVTQRQKRTAGQTSAAVKRRIESSSSSSSSSSDITRKRQRYEYNEDQRRLLSDAFAHKSTPTSSELDELTVKLRTVDSVGRRLDKSNVRIWFQNRRREHKQQLVTSSATPSSTSLSSAAATERASDVSKAYDWPVSCSVTWFLTRDNVMEAVSRLARYCITPTDISDCTLFNYSTYTAL